LDNHLFAIEVSLVKSDDIIMTDPPFLQNYTAAVTSAKAVKKCAALRIFLLNHSLKLMDSDIKFVLANEG
jgi:hypothetical protein